MITFPGLIDIGTLIPKGNWAYAMDVAAKSGYTALLAAPLEDVLYNEAADAEPVMAEPAASARIDYARFAAVKPDNVRTLEDWEPAAPAVMTELSEPDMDNVFGQMHMLTRLFNRWPKEKPIIISGEAGQIGSALFMAQTNRKHVHVHSVYNRAQMELILEAKEKGAEVTCDVHPLSLLVSKKGDGKDPLKRMGEESDRKFLVENLSQIDCFSSQNYAASEERPYGGLRSMVPVLLILLQKGVLTEEDIRKRVCDAPRSIFGLYPHSETSVLIDEDRPGAGADIAEHAPFGKILRVTLRDKVIYDSEEKYVTEKSGYHLKGYRA